MGHDEKLRNQSRRAKVCVVESVFPFTSTMVVIIRFATHHEPSTRDDGYGRAILVGSAAAACSLFSKNRRSK
jgi:hypothetical protein